MLKNMNSVLQAIAQLFDVFSLLIMVRIFLSWAPSLAYSRPARILAAITDPYLNIFRSMRFLRIGGMFDFSPVAALLVLSLVKNIFLQIVYMGTFSLASLLALTVRAVWSVVSFLLIFFIALSAIRLISLLFFKGGGAFFSALDNLLAPPVRRLSHIVARKRIVSYRFLLILLIAAMALLFFAGRYLAALLLYFIYQIKL